MLNTGIVAKFKDIVDKIRYDEINYIPSKIDKPSKLAQTKSKAWVGLESIILDIINFSKIDTQVALEFGVEFGYSTSVFANYFEKVIGVDTFLGDIHAGHHGDLLEETKNNLRSFSNIELIKSDYKDFIKTKQGAFDLIHVDIVHTYEDTFACGLWSARNSKCTLFHDTQSFPDVKRAVSDIAKETNKKFYNYKKFNGLGILI